jgi:hypothetical protein
VKSRSFHHPAIAGPTVVLWNRDAVPFVFAVIDEPNVTSPFS